ncbi:beta-lactamase-like protein [Mycena pura]|uniref:Beta-lactamase-like protein n=1 Tax=Mycena pura TaxID=153505 RepID=A0AAD6YEL1_9AGAR|nr:beta-lactamase-like protein [Mycena pura]
MLLLGILSSAFLAKPASAAFGDFGIPASHATVDVRMFNVGTIFATTGASTFIHPVLPGHENASSPMYSFLLEHGASGQRLMFDLGLRKDPQNLAPILAAQIATGLFQLDEPKDITEMLQEGGIALETIDTVIWSHAHLDHFGDMSKFPNTTGLVIGSETDTSTFPENPNGTLQTSDFAGRTVTKIDFATANLTFSGLKAIDYFNDGSLYLLNTPGHLPGHLTALARVTPSSFVVLGGDTFHHAGEARPRPAFQKNFPCPAHLLEETRTSISTDFFWSPRSRVGEFDLPSRAQQLLAVADIPGSVYADPVASQVSLEKVATLDADADFLVIVAHDLSIAKALPFFPASLNSWNAHGLKAGTVWNFVDKANPAFVFSPA